MSYSIHLCVFRHQERRNHDLYPLYCGGFHSFYKDDYCIFYCGDLKLRNNPIFDLIVLILSFKFSITPLIYNCGTPCAATISVTAPIVVAGVDNLPSTMYLKIIINKKYLLPSN